MRRRRMGAVPQLGDLRRVNNFQPTKVDAPGHGAVVEEIEGLIKVYRDGHVERLPVVADVPCTWSPQPDIVSQDVALGAAVWGRLYVPRQLLPGQKLPLVVYFHGGGFCVGSAAWRCYHEFLSRLASRAACVVLSVNYRLAPEHRLPAAYEDGLAAMRWVRQQAAGGHRSGEDLLGWWRSRCDLGRVFLAGDSAGGTMAHHVAARLGSSSGDVLRPVGLRGVVLIQPFFGGVERTWSENNLVQPPKSALSLATSDCYWRMALPPGADRDHPWCNPLVKGDVPRLEDLRLPPALVCVAELDILRDRNREFCKAMRSAGKSVEQATFAGVGHAFQILLHANQNSHVRTTEMLDRIRAFINSNSS